MARFFFTDVIRHTVCPRCHEYSGYPCRSPSRKRTKYPHKERQLALIRSEGFNKDDYLIRRET